MKLLFVLLAVYSCFFMSGCGGSANADPLPSSPQGSSPLVESPQAESEIELLHEGYFTADGSSTVKQSKVISSAAYYQSELSIYSNEQPLDIDFSNNKVLLVDMGTRNEGGFSVSVNELRTAVDEYSVTVNVVFSILAANCPRTDPVITPYIFYRIPTQKEVLVQEKLVVENCD